jgi:hypothetical protein
MIALIVIMGVYPQPFLRTLEASVVRTLVLAGAGRPTKAPVPFRVSSKSEASTGTNDCADGPGARACSVPVAGTEASH